MILCITPNPAVDRTARVGRLAFGEVLRPSHVVVLPGGKGNNVARVVHALGGLVATTGFAGGHAGQWLIEQLEAEGLNPRFVTVAAETRTTSVTIDDAGRSLMLYEPGNPVGDADVERLLHSLATDSLPTASWVAICGSPPPGMGTQGYAAIVAACHAAGRPCLVDVGGDPLAAALGAQPDVVKVSRDEARSVTGERVGDAISAATALVTMGARLAIVTDGPHGAAAADRDSTWEIRVPRIRAVDPIGSGDAFTAGLLVAFEAGRSIDEALAAGAAAGTANAESLGAGRLDVARQAALLDDIHVTRRAR